MLGPTVGSVVQQPLDGATVDLASSYFHVYAGAVNTWQVRKGRQEKEDGEAGENSMCRDKL